MNRAQGRITADTVAEPAKESVAVDTVAVPVEELVAAECAKKNRQRRGGGKTSYEP